MQETYAIAAFRSRQQVLYFEGLFRRAGISTRIVQTPSAVAIGCGLSVAFPKEAVPAANAILRRARPENLVGVYLVEKNGRASRLTALRL